MPRPYLACKPEYTLTINDKELLENLSAWSADYFIRELQVFQLPL